MMPLHFDCEVGDYTLLASAISPAAISPAIFSITAD